MELEKFVQESLMQILRGVKNAQDEINVNPDNIGLVASGNGPQNNIKVDFDIAVTVGESDKGGAGAGIQVWQVFKAGSEIGYENQSQQSTRIKFTLPITLMGSSWHKTKQK